MNEYDVDEIITSVGNVLIGLEDEFNSRDPGSFWGQVIERVCADSAPSASERFYEFIDMINAELEKELEQIGWIFEDVDTFGHEQVTNTYVHRNGEDELKVVYGLEEGLIRTPCDEIIAITNLDPHSWEIYLNGRKIA